MAATLELERPHPGTPDNAWRTAIWLTLAAISMMFMGLTSAYVVSQGLEPGWKQVHMRPLTWIDTGILLLSSLTMETARRNGAIRALAATLSLGLLFLAGQIGVFRQLAQEGYYLSTGRQSSFYYVLTGLHGLHVLGGILALTGLMLRPRPCLRLEVTAVYWHFMGALWLYLLVVFFA
jgi:cytochrome c oxidase subunit 3